MATTPTAATKNPEKDFKPQFNRVQQTCDHDDAFACVAMLAGKTVEEVRQVAVSRFGHPSHGPYWILEDLILKLLAHYSWRGTSYMESSSIASLPDLAIGLIEYKPETDIGRTVLFQRVGNITDPNRVEYIIDPAYWIPEDKQVRTGSKGLPMIYWYIAVTPARPEGK